ncbi:MAG: Hsp20/alpha crystallin family protein [Ardenticatenaceae bacterium]|nr:Hsp20/alpha crystallin family protein [Ardenticatenaceae bacterium]
MSTLVRWNPVRDFLSMRHDMDRMMDSFFGPSSLTMEDQTSWGIALDVVEKNGEYQLKASIPGLKPEEIDVTVNEGLLTIKGETSSEREESEEGKFHLRERRYGRFSRSLRLPNDIDFDKVTAHHEDGVLTLTMPKSEASKPRRIEIK